MLVFPYFYTARRKLHKRLLRRLRTGTFPYKSRLQRFEQVMLMEQLSDSLNMNVEESIGKREFTEDQ